MLETSLDKCNEDLRTSMMKNMIFCGGCSMIPGMEDRIHRELSNFGDDMRIEFDWQRRYSSWIGGSMIGSLSVFQQLAITNQEHSTN
jgi:actin-related protein